ncbi:MAG: TonB-dependent receptor [Chitinophagaceae bacterium]|nr:MAG: TonB-dependent receptor [Chitinophagaceae bacterium]
MRQKYKKEKGRGCLSLFNFRMASKRFCLATAVLLLSFLTVYAQQTDVTGRVTDANNGNALVGVTVRVKGTTVGTVTDDNGHFTLQAKPGDILDITYIGYHHFNYVVGDKQHPSIRLKQDFSQLDQVVVIGYGEMKKSDLSSAQVTVSAKQLNQTINTSFDQALQGRAAGVYVTSGSGQPGAAPSVIIRGLGTLTQNAQPLYVIDGVQIRPPEISGDPNNLPAGYSNALSAINPSDIASINVLEGPSATAIYGAAGANGVIIVTTKQGTAGKTKISVSSTLTVQDKPKHIAVMNLPQYAKFRNEMAAAGGTATDPNFADPSILGPGTDWQNALYRRTLMQNDEFSLSGGTGPSTFYFSGNYLNQEGIAPGSGFQRYSTRLNLTNQTRQWLKIGTNLNLGYTTEKVNTTNAGIINLALQQNPSIPVKNPDGSWGGPSNTQFQYSNPIMLATINNDYDKRLDFIGSVYADISPVKGLTFHNELNGNVDYFNYYTFHPGYTAGGYVVPQSAATSSRTATNNYWWSVNNQLQYHFDIGENDVTVMASHEAQAWTYESLYGWRQNFITNEVQELSGGDATSISNVQNNSSKSSGSQESYFGRLNYIFNNKYILQATYRADGNSNFGPNNRWGYFPSLSVAWRISQESFMKTLSAINDLKLRFEIGTSGNAGSAGGVYAALQTVPTPWGTGFLSQKFPNPDLKWETDKTTDVGFDLHMFNSRLEVIADAYIKKSTNLITVNTYPFALGGDISYSAGYIQWPTVNAGSMQNKGFDLTVNTVNIDNHDLQWNTGITFSLNRNKITSLLNTINPDWNATQVQFISEVGKPASMITGYIAEGLFQNYKDISGHAIQTSNGVMTVSPQGTWVGDIKFKDLNGDGVIDQNDRTIVGNPWPKFTFGFNNSFSYKNFNLNIFMQGSVGNDIVNYPRYTNEIPGNTGTYGNYYESVTNVAIPSSYSLSDSSAAVLTNPGHTIPRVAPGDPNGNNRMSQWFVESGSYLRIKNVTLGYNFPEKWISHLAMTGLRAALSVQNLLTITGYQGYDPEIGMMSYGGTLMVGVDQGRYPSTRMYSFSLSADF